MQVYRKLHLFDIDLTHKGGLSVQETKYIEPGKEIPEPIISPVGYVGPSIVSKKICLIPLQSNDLRYPELYRRYVLHGA